MAEPSMIQEMRKQRRYIRPAKSGDTNLGPFKWLPGTWANVRRDANGEPTDAPLPGRGWNIIALPFADGRFNYRVLMNQYNEELKFTTVSTKVPNRGIDIPKDQQTDQFAVALDYEQTITQIAVGDHPPSDDGGEVGDGIHHEPGLFLYMLNETTPHIRGQKEEPLSIGRLGTVPHGNSVLALGNWEKEQGPVDIPPDVSALPFGTTMDLNNPYLEPYKHFQDNPFEGLFRPLNTSELLGFANQPDQLDGFEIKRTTTLNFDTELEDAGILNIPFVVKQADAASMQSTFWIQELSKGRGKEKQTKLRLQYLQVVMLDFFFPRRDGMPGPVRWPHISINTMEKIADPEDSESTYISGS